MNENNQNNNSQTQNVYQEAALVMDGVSQIVSLIGRAIVLLCGARFLINEFSK